jgi:hypothetical protein
MCTLLSLKLAPTAVHVKYMKHIFSAFGAKAYHWREFTKFCFCERGSQEKEARQITKLGMSVLSLLPQSMRQDLRLQDFQAFVAHIYGIYLTALTKHDSVQVLTLSGHSVDSMMLLRSQLETVLAFLYVTEPQDDRREVYKRIDRYRDWVVVKMEQNMESSLKLNLVQVLVEEDFITTVRGNYELVKAKYGGSSSEFVKLEKAHNFLSPPERELIADRFGIEDLYHHIYSESSASIHFADISARMHKIGEFGYHYPIREKHGAFWPLMLSNLLQFHCILQFGKFFGIDSILVPKLGAIFVSNSRAGHQRQGTNGKTM